MRAYTPWPGAFTTLRGRRLKIRRAHVVAWRGPEPPGQVVALLDGQAAVVTGEGALALDEVQLAGKRAMPSQAFCCGYQDFVGSMLGETA